jgi:predicted dithiol-disulfide oxidoreductase (DUF899 family)
MGRTFPWVSSSGSDFNDDFGVSSYTRGIDMTNGTCQLLDLVPKGRDEPPGENQLWVRRHDDNGG